MMSLNNSTKFQSTSNGGAKSASAASAAGSVTTTPSPIAAAAAKLKPTQINISSAGSTTAASAGATPRVRSRWDPVVTTPSIRSNASATATTTAAARERPNGVTPVLVPTVSMLKEARESTKPATTASVVPATTTAVTSAPATKPETKEASAKSSTTSATAAAKARLAEEEDSSIASSLTSNGSATPAPTTTTTTTGTSSTAQNNHHQDGGAENLNDLRKSLTEAQQLNKQLKQENDMLHEELQDIRHEMEELQDQFRLDDADEFRQLQAELEIAAKNCRILQFKLRKLEKRNEHLETEKLLLQDKMDEFGRETNKMLELEEELLIAKEVSIRLHSELEQAQEWRLTTEKLNEELKKQLDELKDYLDNEIKSRELAEEHSQLIIVNKLYESMFREYFLQEQLYSLSCNSSSQNVSKQLREVTDLLNSYQQKISILNDEIGILKHQLIAKDKELDQHRIQLKNLKRSRSSDSTYERSKRQISFSNSLLLNGSGGGGGSSSGGKTTTPEDAAEAGMERKQRSMSVDTCETLSRQVEISADEIRLLRNKVSRLEDDLLLMTQERDGLLVQLDEKMEERAMKSFTTLDAEELEPASTTTNASAAAELEEASVLRQMSGLKKKIDQLNSEAKQNEESKNQLSDELKQLRQQLDEKLREISKIKEQESPTVTEKTAPEETKKGEETAAKENLTDADKLLQDECKQLRGELEQRDSLIGQMRDELQTSFAAGQETRKLLELREARVKELTESETTLQARLVESDARIGELGKQLQETETSMKKLRDDLDFKLGLEKDLRTDRQQLNEKLTNMNAQLRDKMCEIEFLNKENLLLQERVNGEDERARGLAGECEAAKGARERLVKELELKSAEAERAEALVRKKELEIGELSQKLLKKELVCKDKLEEAERSRRELQSLQDKYAALGSTLENRVAGLSAEIERLNKDKEQLNADLAELKAKHTSCNVTNPKSSIENEIDHERAVLQKLEQQAANAKYENKIQYLEVEIDTLRSKIRKLLKEKELQDQVLKENQLLVKEIALKYTTDSDAWNRQKQKLLEKEKLYEESVDMRKELKKAADKLRQKLQSLEEQIIDKQNKHTIEKNSWETQRLQYVSANNKLEEQLSKLSTLKRSKKEMEFAWDKERKEMGAHIVQLETFIRDLQAQLTQRNTTLAQVSDQYGQNERIQSLTGENEFLKNRIKELEIMLDEMEQVKRFLFDVKEAYDADRQEWQLCKDEFRYQLELKENLWLECNSKLNEIVNVIRAMQSNEPLPGSVVSRIYERGGGGNGELGGSTSNVNENLTLNNLVGGTSSLLELKFGAGATKSGGLSPGKSTVARSKLPAIDGKLAAARGLEAAAAGLEHEDILLIDTSKDRKELETEFEQAFKKMNRVKDNYKTHMKFMDIVKSKSMKALNRKSSTNSLMPMNEAGARCSVPPPEVETAVPTPRAKSVSKEPSTEPGGKHSIFTAPSRFLSLSRHFAKIRFSSSQPPGSKSKTPEPREASIEPLASRLQPPPPQILIDEDKSGKSNLRERALSPSRLLRSLRPRSPFGRTNRASVASLQQPGAARQSSQPPASSTVSSSTMGNNKSFTVGGQSGSPSGGGGGSNRLSSNEARNSSLLNYSYRSTSVNSTGEPSSPEASSSNFSYRNVRANTAAPFSSDRYSLPASSANDKLRSMSCEYIDNSSTLESTSRSVRAAAALNDIPDENESVSLDSTASGAAAGSISYGSGTGSTSLTARRLRKLNLAGFSSYDKKESFESSTSGAEVVKTVKFKEPPEKMSPASDNDEDGASDSEATTAFVDSSLKSTLSDDTARLLLSSSGGEDDRLGALGFRSKSPRLATTELANGSATGSSSSTPSTLPKMRTSLSSSNVDRPPKHPPGPPGAAPTSPATSNGSAATSATKSKLIGAKSRTIDFPDILQNPFKASDSTAASSTRPYLTSSGRPIQSILRRSETPPSTKTGAGRQMSIESHEARETSLEKILKASSSTSRPLMFSGNNNGQ